MAKTETETKTNPCERKLPPHQKYRCTVCLQEYSNENFDVVEDQCPLCDNNAGVKISQGFVMSTNAIDINDLERLGREQQPIVHKE